MKYAIHREIGQLNSTGYIEIGPGRYSGKHWQSGFIFVAVDSFSMAAGIVEKHFHTFNHFGINEVPKEIGIKIIEEWQTASEMMFQMPIEDAPELLNLFSANRYALENELKNNQKEISSFLADLSMECKRFYENQEWLCMLGL